MQKWNTLTNRAQRVDMSSGVICSDMFTPRVMVIKTSKIAFFVLYADDSKNQSWFGQNI